MVSTNFHKAIFSFKIVHFLRFSSDTPLQKQIEVLISVAISSYIQNLKFAMAKLTKTLICFKTAYPITNTSYVERSCSIPALHCGRRGDHRAVIEYGLRVRCYALVFTTSAAGISERKIRRNRGETSKPEVHRCVPEVHRRCRYSGRSETGWGNITRLPTPTSGITETHAIHVGARWTEKRKTTSESMRNVGTISYEIFRPWPSMISTRNLKIGLKQNVGVFEGYNNIEILILLH